MAAESLFVKSNPEDANYNQYWYSPHTIARIVDELLLLGGRMGFLSTPSIYFSLPEESRENSYVFDFDRKWQNDRGFVFYDFNDFENIPSELFGTFDVLVIDPPFITNEVWGKYAKTAKLLLKSGKDSSGVPNGKVILTTVMENAPHLNDMFDVLPQVFKPSIPNLVYQYDLYTNFPAQILSKANPEIPE